MTMIMILFVHLPLVTMKGLLLLSLQTYNAGKAMHSSLIYDAFQNDSRDQPCTVESHQASFLSYYYAISLEESYVEYYIMFDNSQITNLSVYCFHL